MTQAGSAARARGYYNNYSAIVICSYEIKGTYMYTLDDMLLQEKKRQKSEFSRKCLPTCGYLGTQRSEVMGAHTES